MVVLVVFKERFVGADDLGVLAETGTNPHSKVNDALDPIGWQELVADDFFTLLTYSINAACPLNQANNRPR